MIAAVWAAISLALVATCRWRLAICWRPATIWQSPAAMWEYPAVISTRGEMIYPQWSAVLKESTLKYQTGVTLCSGRGRIDSRLNVTGGGGPSGLR